MNIPLSRLYQYIESVSEKINGGRVIIYRFNPHGSKNIQDLSNLHQDTWFEHTIHPNVWCHDQEPLDHEYYQKNTRQWSDELSNLLDKIAGKVEVKNLNYNNDTIFSKGLLLHSEQRSENLTKYEQDNELLPVYYWSHAVIARDWFRYAEHVEQRKQVACTFLIYSRAWSGTREYRLKFAELLIDLNLQKHCKTSVNPIEPELGIHYELHTFKNPRWRPETVLENYFPTSDAHSHYSADFDIGDYESTDIEVVLETLFDDSRLHLTEKSLRPIACGQPFMLAGTVGSLEYLRSYGFKTFGSIWGEYYDCIENPQERLVYIATTMRHIANWTPEERATKMAQAQTIADYNRQHFFSQEFFNRVTSELKTNLTSAFAILNSLHPNKQWIDRWSKIIDSEEFKQMPELNSLSLATATEAMRLAQSRL